MRTFNHVGMVLQEKMEGMIYVEPLKVHITDCSQSPNKIEFLYFEPDTPLPQLMQQQAHIAYAVPNIEEAIKDTKLLFGPFDMGHMLLAFVEEEVWLLSLTNSSKKSSNLALLAAGLIEIQNSRFKIQNWQNILSNTELGRIFIYTRHSAFLHW